MKWNYQNKNFAFAQRSGAMKAPVGLVEQSRNPEPFGAVLALKKFRVLCNVFFGGAVLQQPILYCVTVYGACA